MILSGLSFAAAEFAGFEKPEEKQRRSQQRKGDTDEGRRDGTERQEIQQKARAECRHRGPQRLAPREVLGAVHQVIEVGRRVERLFFLHGNQRIAARRTAARIGISKVF